MSEGVWDGLDKSRVSRALVTAFLSDEYLEVLAAVNNAESLAELSAAREHVKELMALWRQECPDYAFIIDALFLFSEKMEQLLTDAASEEGEEKDEETAKMPPAAGRD